MESRVLTSSRADHLSLVLRDVQAHVTSGVHTGVVAGGEELRCGCPVQVATGVPGRAYTPALNMPCQLLQAWSHPCENSSD